LKPKRSTRQPPSAWLHFKRHPFSATIGPATRLEIQILEPSVVHTVSVHQVQRWLSGATASPNERVRKDKLKALLA
jgi:hypothetical protein